MTLEVFRREKFREEMRLRKVESLDRHELEKVLESLGFQVVNCDTLEHLKDSLREFLRTNKVSLEEVM